MKVIQTQMDSRVPHHIPGVSCIMVQPLLDGKVPYGRPQRPLPVFPIDRMKPSHAENDYIDCPAVVSRQPPGHKEPPGALPRCHDVTHPWISVGGRPSSLGSCSSGSTSSEQRLLDAPVASVRATTVTTRPAAKCPVAKATEDKPQQQQPQHYAMPCQACGRCRCTDCTLPRTLPSCWVCKQEFLCSVQNLVDAATCMCLVKGVFYHCSDQEEDEEGSCAERPCRCAPGPRSDCCARWAFMGALSLALPCLLCYLPATGCAQLSQRCYDRLSRPGCRCKSSLSAEPKCARKEKQPS